MTSSTSFSTSSTRSGESVAGVLNWTVTIPVSIGGIRVLPMSGGMVRMVSTKNPAVIMRVTTRQLSAAFSTHT